MNINKEKQTMPDYSKGKIYTIRNSDDDTKIYVGSTIQPLSVRLGGHKKRSNDKRKIILNYTLKLIMTGLIGI